MIPNCILLGDALTVLKTLPSGSVHACVTSPPYYGLRDYGTPAQLGREASPSEYIAKLSAVFSEVYRVLKDNGTLWLNIADSYAGRCRIMCQMPNGMGGVKPKDMLGIPWAVAFALRANAWHLRSDIIWHKTNPMPEGVKDRPAKAHEHIFLLSKSPAYYFDYASIQEPTKPSTLARAKRAVGQHKYVPGAPGQPAQRIWQPRGQGELEAPELCRKRDVWTVATSSYQGAHFATCPVELLTPCILAGCPEGGVVLDPFFGSGTTGVAALRLNLQFVGIEIKPDFCELARKRLAKEGLEVPIIEP
jgi:DNA modification methylase